MASFQGIIEFFTQKFVTKLSKIWVWDPGSGKNLFRIPDPILGVKKAPDPGSGSATLELATKFQQGLKEYDRIIVKYAKKAWILTSALIRTKKL